MTPGAGIAGAEQTIPEEITNYLQTQNLAMVVEVALLQGGSVSNTTRIKTSSKISLVLKQALINPQDNKIVLCFSNINTHHPHIIGHGSPAKSWVLFHLTGCKPGSIPVMAMDTAHSRLASCGSCACLLGMHSPEGPRSS